MDIETTVAASDQGVHAARTLSFSRAAAIHLVQFNVPRIFPLFHRSDLYWNGPRARRGRWRGLGRMGKERHQPTLWRDKNESDKH